MGLSHVFIRPMIAALVFCTCLVVMPQRAYSAASGVIALSGHALFFTVTGGLALVGYANDQRSAMVRSSSVNQTQRRNYGVMILVGLVLNESEEQRRFVLDYNARLQQLTDYSVYSIDEAQIIQSDLQSMEMSKAGFVIDLQKMNSKQKIMDYLVEHTEMSPLTIDFMLNIVGVQAGIPLEK